RQRAEVKLEIADFEPGTRFFRSPQSYDRDRGARVSSNEDTFERSDAKVAHFDRPRTAGNAEGQIGWVTTRSPMSGVLVHPRYEIQGRPIRLDSSLLLQCLDISVLRELPHSFNLLPCRRDQFLRTPRSILGIEL